ncbi:hypothetical protein MVEN_00965200 [Mycena venus]|uniref:F-box domain-containing protein n=1 Tax=Mycena venus TaxID=2733690 RepID=A0A8H6YDI4_9AGAR|nr:hypothetical protein MVEN_00965200 [Mycena venus]
MVLTRRATLASKSIIRWLPNEMLTAVMRDASKPDLLALSATSRLFRNIATPLLYRTIQLSTIAQVNYFLRTMEQRSGTLLSRYVRNITITAGHGDRLKITLSLPLVTVTALGSVLPRLCHLERLKLEVSEVTPSSGFVDMLQHAQFPNLSAFHHSLRMDTAALVSSFINRHPTITNLTLTLRERLEQWNPILLPNLTVYHGPSTSIASVDFHGRSVALVSLSWYPDDFEVEQPLLQLGSIASPEIFMAIFCDLEGTTILGSTARNLPHVRHIHFRKTLETPQGVSPHDALEIADLLKKFDALSILELFIDQRTEHDSERDRETIVLWGEACKTLVWIALYEGRWMRVQGHWIFAIRFSSANPPCLHISYTLVRAYGANVVCLVRVYLPRPLNADSGPETPLFWASMAATFQTFLNSEVGAAQRK